MPPGDDPVKNPFLDAMKGPMAMVPATKFMQLLQEQQSDNIETSVKALACRDPMALMTLQQSYVKRMVDRWSKMASLQQPATETKAAPSRAQAPAPKAAPAAPAPKPAPAPVAPVPAPVAEAKVWDDLTVIKGIGPKFAQTLNEHGITSYGQLASLSEAEIEALESKLGFSGRFEREGWVEQARALAH